ncbi:LytTR family DNA-binding domain-containing protein [Massilia sp. CFBP9026]|uniref:LytR/AlgR family response regulator transcription factor n=1 Tax=Massilia sp. CFBP9026 TaxID=3096536 RepID=UPI002A6B356F|nr:LytTR family DNA-binding domain-containing protein [Massilia sp. CFBP9026]MDY0965634.1 LytTR family DNA-binding domain-containing protein [Massilia sp. CFBP9026]
MSRRPTALIADDEPLLRETMVRLLAQAWPELEVVALARNGRDALAQFEATCPDVCFLDIHMPGMSGLDAAQGIGERAHLVFVTAFDEYAVRAFAQGALDYLVKPVEPERLADTTARMRRRLQADEPVLNTEALLRQLSSRLKEPPAQFLRWIRATIGQALHLIAVDQIDYLRSDERYTLVAWHDEHGAPVDALIRTPLKELVTQLDPAQFAQVHRSVVINLSAVNHVLRGPNETAEIHFKHRSSILKASRAYQHLFRQM